MDESVRTTCARCAVGCGLRTTPLDESAGRDGRPYRVRGDRTHPVSGGLACRRGIEETAGAERQRLTEPLVRRGGELVAVNWSRALETIGRRLRDQLAEPNSIGVLGSGQQTTEAAYLLGKVARGTIGTRNYDANTTLCMASAVAAYYGAFGSDGPPPTYDDIPDAENHVVWGANPAVSHPVLFSWIRQSAADGSLIVVDPVATKTAEAADRHIRPRPGDDRALARAVLASMVESGQCDTEFIEANTTGFDRLRSALPEPAAAAEEVDVSEADIEDLAAALDSSTLLYWGMGVNQSVRGTATARALIDLCLASGNLGSGSGPFSLTGQANSMGTRLASSKGTWPGHREFEDDRHRQTVADHWEVPVERLPDETGPGPVGIIDGIHESEIDTLWTVATNPAVGLPNASSGRTALDDAFLIVQDAFRSETVEYADVVLPAATWGETDGTLVSMDRTVSRVRPSRQPPGDARRDAEIIAAVGETLRPGRIGTTEPASVFESFAALTDGTPADCTHISHERVDEEGAVRWPWSTAESERYRYARPDSTFRFPTPSGRARFSVDVAAGAPEQPNRSFPLVATTARRSEAYNTAVRTHTERTPPTARVSPATFAAWRDRLTDVGGDTAETTVVSRRGRVRARVQADPAVPDGVVWLPIHATETNVLTPDGVDPVSDEPAYKTFCVRFDPDP